MQIIHWWFYTYGWILLVWGLTLKQAEDYLKSAKGSDPKTIDKLVHLLFKAILYAEYLSPCCESMKGFCTSAASGTFLLGPFKAIPQNVSIDNVITVCQWHWRMFSMGKVSCKVLFTLSCSISCISHIGTWHFSMLQALWLCGWFSVGCTPPHSRFVLMKCIFNVFM